MNSKKDISNKKDSLWNNCLIYIKDRIPDQAFQTWFSSVQVATINDEEIVLQVPNKFHYEWLESKYRVLIDDGIKDSFNHPLIVNYSIVISDKKSDEKCAQKSKIYFEYAKNNFYQQIRDIVKKK